MAVYLLSFLPTVFLSLEIKFSKQKHRLVTSGFQKATYNATIRERLDKYVGPQNNRKEKSGAITRFHAWKSVVWGSFPGFRKQLGGIFICRALRRMETTLVSLLLFSKACWKSLKPLSSGSMSVQKCI